MAARSALSGRAARKPLTATHAMLLFVRTRKGRKRMTSCRRLVSMAVVAGFLVLLPGCHRETPTAVGPLYIMLTYNGGNCEQNGSTGVLDVYQNQSVIFQGASAVSQFQVQFDRCPFTSCPVNSPNGTPVNVGPPNANTAGNTYNYTSMTINNLQCNNPGPMGMRIRTP